MAHAEESVGEEDLITGSAGYDAVERLVSRLYLDVLNRNYDRAGLDDWASQLRRGTMTGGEAAYGFFFSSEFISKGLDNREFIRRLYIALLDRVPDKAGETAWVDQLNFGIPRENVFAGFVNSVEFDAYCRAAGIVRGTYVPPSGGSGGGSGGGTGGGSGGSSALIGAFVTRLYKTTLQREPDRAGLDNWVKALEAGGSGAQVAHGFIFSTEMDNRSLSDEQFVEILYQALMGRGSDPAGKTSWVNILQSGYSRHSIFVGFVNSNEFDIICRNHGITKGTAPLPPVVIRPLPGKVIFLDPGHGTVGSPGYAGYNEAVAMLGLARRIRTLLEQTNATVIMTRNNEVNVPIATRCAMINIHSLETVKSTRTNPIEIAEIDRLIGIMKDVIDNPIELGPIYMNLDPFRANTPIHPDLQRIFEYQNDPVIRDNYLVISLHSNATGTGATNVRGAEVYYISPFEVANTRQYYPGFSFTAQGRNFADILLNHIQNAGIPRRANGLRAANYAMIREINVPAVLTENGFHTNAQDRALLSSSVFMDNLAIEYLNAITRYFN